MCCAYRPCGADVNVLCLPSLRDCLMCLVTVPAGLSDVLCVMVTGYRPCGSDLLCLITVPEGLMCWCWCLPSLRGWCVVLTILEGLIYLCLWDWCVVFTVPEGLMYYVYRPWSDRPCGTDVLRCPWDWCILGKCTRELRTWTGGAKHGQGVQGRYSCLIQNLDSVLQTQHNTTTRNWKINLMTWNQIGKYELVRIYLNFNQSIVSVRL